MRSLADFKRAMTVGTVVDMTNHKYPQLSGKRRVLRAQTNSLCFSFPPGHEKYKAEPENDGAGSWLDMPKASQCTFNDDGSISIGRSAQWGDTGPFVTIRLVDKEQA